MRLLLINPKFPESFWTFKWVIDEILPGRRASNPPLGLATLAALCPPDWEVTIVDENVESLPLAPDADIVGVCGMGVQFARQCELLAYYRARGHYVVAGGSYASLCPEKYAGLVDTVVAGEAEYIWPQFCADYAVGCAQPLCREEGTVALTDSPVPRFDLLKLDRYSMASLQFSRGCPYRCEFCDIIVMFGRRPRVKSLEQVGRELDALRAQGVRRAFFVDDNLIGNRPRALELLAFLADYQQRHGYRFSFGTEASLNLARDDELLRRFRAANFTWVFIGIETTDEASLKETLKTQNTGGDILADVRRLYAYGIDVLAGFIVGFDHDTLATFEQQRRFIMDSGIQSAMIGLLHAMPRTPLYERLEREGRLRATDSDCDNTRASTNIVPKSMDYDAMIEHYEALYRDLLTDAAIATRVRNKRRAMRNPLYGGGFTPRETAQILWRLLTRGILPGGPRRWWAFARSVPWLAAEHIPWAISDWIIALSMADTTRRRLAPPAPAAGAERWIDALRRAVAPALADGRAALHVARQPARALTLTLRGLPDAACCRRAARALELLLARTPGTVTLHVEALRDAAGPPVQPVLRRLRRHGDRVSVVL
ncbi:MAG: radical SAM protein, partial [Betaproteobacteria bacterium]